MANNSKENKSNKALRKLELLRRKILINKKKENDFNKILHELLQLKEILATNNIEKIKLKEMLAQNRYTLLEKIILALCNNDDTFIKSLPRVQIKKLGLNSNIIYETYYMVLNTEDMIFETRKILQIKNKISKIKSFSTIEKRYIIDQIEGNYGVSTWEIIKESQQISEAILFKVALIRGDKNLLNNKTLANALLISETQFFTIQDKIKCFQFILDNNLCEINYRSSKRVLIDFVMQNKETILEIMKKDKNLKQKYFRELNICWKYIGAFFIEEGGLETFAQSEEFQQNIYNNKNANKVGEIEEFFKDLPEQYKHLIVYFSADKYENGYEKREMLYKRYYKKYYSDELQEDEIEQLIKYMEGIQLSNIYGEYDIILSRENIEFILKKLNFDKQFFKKITKIKDLYLDGNLNDAINFAIKYSQTQLFKDLLEVKNINKDLKEKIVYLAKNYKIVDIETLEQVNSMTIEELKKCLFELPALSETIKSSMIGTGRAQHADFQIFSTSREILIIGFDNTFEHEEASIDHKETLELMYSKKIKFKYNSVFEIACQVCKKLNDIILITEGETLYIYLPHKISKIQKNKFIELIQGIKNFELISLGIAIIDDDNVKIFDINRTKQELLTSKIFEGQYVKTIEEKGINKKQIELQNK